jgi:ubiquinone biosynthesis protein
MNKLKQFFRLIHIYLIIIHYRLDEIVFDAFSLRTLHFLSNFNPLSWYKRPNLTRGERIRLALETLGPVFVKFGQSLSTRRDVLPPDIADELAKLQDQVAPFSGEIAKAIVEKEYKQTTEEIFAYFETTPMASASIAQVHKATLHDGKDVVVKILRPDIIIIIQRDIALMYTLAKLVSRYWIKARRLRPREVVAEFENTILNELDLMREAANASQLHRNFLNSPLLHVPEIYWPYARNKILVMERIHGIPISNIETLKEYHFDLKKLAERGVEIFFTQVFRDCFFHADMHPGNIFVANDNPHDPQYIAVDFGIMGSLSPQDQRYLAENFLAFFNRDYRRVAILHVESGWVPSETRIEHLEAAIRTVCEPIFEKPLAEISVGQMLLRLFQTAARFNMEIQPQLVLLQKTLLNIEGLGRQLYPQLNLWDTAKPYIERWMRSQIGPRAFLRKVKENTPIWLERLPELPDLVYKSLNQLSLNNNKVSYTNLSLNSKESELPIKKYFSVSSFIWGILSTLLLLFIITSFKSHYSSIIGWISVTR